MRSRVLAWLAAGLLLSGCGGTDSKTQDVKFLDMYADWPDQHGTQNAIVAEQKAQEMLQAAHWYRTGGMRYDLLGTGRMRNDFYWTGGSMRHKAREILKKMVADYPGTAAAKAAEREIKELEKRYRRR